MSLNAYGQQRPEISAVITCYYEEMTIEKFHHKLTESLRKSARTYEIILVNDGSMDKTFEKLNVIFSKDPHVYAILDLFKNAGQAAAITAGLCEARGDILLSMDSDLQLDPAELPFLLEKYDAGNDVVSGSRTNRKDSWRRILPSKIANLIMRKASGKNFTDFGCTFKLYNMSLIRAFQFGPHRIFNPVTIISRAQRCVEVPVSHLSRQYGESGWTFQKLWRYQMEHIVNLSERPFQLVGLFCLMLAGFFMLRSVGSFVSSFHFLDKVTTGLLLNGLLISTLTLLFVLSIVGEYTIRCFIAVQANPQYIIRTLKKRDVANPRVE